MRKSAIGALVVCLLSCPASAQPVAELDQYDLGVHCAAVEMSYASIFIVSEEGAPTVEALMNGVERWLSHAQEARPEVDEDAMLEDLSERTDVITADVNEKMGDESAGDESMQMLFSCFDAEAEIFGESSVSGL